VAVFGRSRIFPPNPSLPLSPAAYFNHTDTQPHAPHHSQRLAKPIAPREGDRARRRGERHKARRDLRRTVAWAYRPLTATLDD
jgi:hypothetical protein